MEHLRKLPFPFPNSKRDNTSDLVLQPNVPTLSKGSTGLRGAKTSCGEMASRYYHGSGDHSFSRRFLNLCHKIYERKNGCQTQIPVIWIRQYSCIGENALDAQSVHY